MLLENKNAIVYGAGGGIGGGVARTFAREGARVFLAGRAARRRRQRGRKRNRGLNATQAVYPEGEVIWITNNQWIGSFHLAYPIQEIN